MLADQFEVYDIVGLLKLYRLQLIAVGWTWLFDFSVCVIFVVNCGNFETLYVVNRLVDLGTNSFFLVEC